VTEDRTELQLAAWEDYRRARHQADRSLSFDDCKAAAIAWKRFADLFVEYKTDTARDYRKVATFPIHKTRLPGGV
jgi:hypothetical protein